MWHGRNPSSCRCLRPRRTWIASQNLLQGGFCEDNELIFGGTAARTFDWHEVHVLTRVLVPVVLKMLKTLHGSGGIVQGKTSKGLDIATEAEKWKAEFGEENAIELEKIVRANMPDYEYMLARRLQL